MRTAGELKKQEGKLKTMAGHCPASVQLECALQGWRREARRGRTEGMMGRKGLWEVCVELKNMARSKREK